MKNNGMSITAVLGTIFVALKLSKVITWSWWLVLLPFYIGPAIAISIVLLYVIGQGGQELMAKMNEDQEEDGD